MDQKSKLDDVAATEVHNRLAKQIVSQIVNEPIAAGGNISDVMVLCESVLVSVVLRCFQLGRDGLDHRHVATPSPFASGNRPSSELATIDAGCRRPEHQLRGNDRGAVCTPR